MMAGYTKYGSGEITNVEGENPFLYWESKWQKLIIWLENINSKGNKNQIRNW